MRAAGAAAVIKALAHGFEQWLHFFEDFLRAADHEGEVAAFGAGFGAGAGGVKEIDAFGGAAGGCRLGIGAGHGGSVNDDGTGLRGFHEAIGAEDGVFGHGRIADDEEDNVGGGGNVLRSGAGRGQVRKLGGKLLRFGSGVAPEGHLVAGRQQITGHGVTHDAQTQKS